MKNSNNRRPDRDHPDRDSSHRRSPHRSSSGVRSPTGGDHGDDDAVVIHSTANDRIRRLVKCRDNNRTRRREGVVLVDGWRLVERLIELGLRGEALYVAEGEPVPASLPPVNTPPVNTPPINAPPIIRVTAAVMRHVAFGQTASPVVGVFRFEPRRMEQLAVPDDGLVLVADKIEKPGNLGAMFRTADAAGVDTVLMCDRGDPGHPTAIRNSQAASLSLPSASVDCEAAIERLTQRGFTILAARVESSEPIDTVDFRGPTAIVVGNEAEGLADRWRGPAIRGVQIPMAGHVDSLNVSVSAAVLMMEAARQRRIAGQSRRSG